MIEESFSIKKNATGYNAKLHEGFKINRLTPLPIRCIRFFRLGTHIIYALFLVGIVFSLVSRASRKKIIASWSGKVLSILNIEIRIIGATNAPPGSMIVANHISWLDIYLLNSVYPARFIAKSEIRDWPVFGWIAIKCETLFIERAKRRDTARLNHAIADVLRQGDYVMIFPEGTTSDGTRLNPFYSSLLQPAVEASCPMQPAAIRYCGPNGETNTAASYVGEQSLLESIIEVIRQPKMIAELTYPPIIATENNDRRQLAKLAENSISQTLSLPVASKKSASPGDPANEPQ